MPEYPESYLQLYQATLGITESAGLTISDSAAQFVMSHARRAVEKLERGDEPLRGTPLGNFVELGQALVRMAQDAPDSHRIDSSTVERALAWICPLWPFC